MTIAAENSLNRGLIKQYVPSYYPLQNNQIYDNQKSYKVDLYSPSNLTSSTVNLVVVYIVVVSDFPIDVFQSANVTTNRNINL